MCRLYEAVMNKHFDEALLILQEQTADEWALRDALYYALYVKRDGVLSVIRAIIKQMNGLPAHLMESPPCHTSILSSIRNVEAAKMLVREYKANAASVLYLMKSDIVDMEFAAECLQQATKHEQFTIFYAASLHDSCTRLVQYMAQRYSHLAGRVMNSYGLDKKMPRVILQLLVTTCKDTLYSELPPTVRECLACSDADMSDVQRKELEQKLMVALVGLGPATEWRPSVLRYAILADNLTAALAVCKNMDFDREQQRKVFLHYVTSLDRHRFVDLLLPETLIGVIGDVIGCVVDDDAVNCMRVLLDRHHANPYINIGGNRVHLANAMLVILGRRKRLHNALLQMVLDWPPTASAPLFAEPLVFGCEETRQLCMAHPAGIRINSAPLAAVKSVLQRYDDQIASGVDDEWTLLHTLERWPLCDQFVKARRVSDIQMIMARHPTVFSSCCFSMLQTAMNANDVELVNLMLPNVDVMQYWSVLKFALSHNHPTWLHMAMKHSKNMSHSLAHVTQLALDACKRGDLDMLRIALDSGYVDPHTMLVDFVCPPCMLYVLLHLLTASTQCNTNVRMSTARQNLILQPIKQELDQLYDVLNNMENNTNHYDANDDDDDEMFAVCCGIVMEETALRMRQMRALMERLSVVSQKESDQQGTIL